MQLITAWRDLWRRVIYLVKMKKKTTGWSHWKYYTSTGLLNTWLSPLQRLTKWYSVEASVILVEFKCESLRYILVWCLVFHLKGECSRSCEVWSEWSLLSEYLMALYQSHAWRCPGTRVKLCPLIMTLTTNLLSPDNKYIQVAINNFSYKKMVFEGLVLFAMHRDNSCIQVFFVRIYCNLSVSFFFKLIPKIIPRILYHLTFAEMDWLRRPCTDAPLACWVVYSILKFVVR